MVEDDTGGLCIIGWTFATSFMSSGKSLPLTSDVDMQDTMTCSMESVGALHSVQAGLKVG